MMYRHAIDLAPGDAVRPFDQQLWHVASVEVPDERGRDHIARGRIMVTFSSTTGDTMSVIACATDLVRLA